MWIADDSPTDAARAQRALAGLYDIELFTDGTGVLERLASQPPPDLLILDWVMPGISGPEVCRFIRSQQRPAAEVAVLLLTAQQDSNQVVEGLSAGANDYVSKPYVDEELRARVAAVMRQRELVERADRAEANVRALLARAPDALLSIDAQGRVLYANEEAERAFERAAEQLIGEAIGTLLPDLPTHSISVGAGESFFPIPDVRIGTQIYSPRVRVLPSDDAAKTTLALRNVTAQRKAEERRLDFYSIIAHDLRTPLSAMLLRMGMMLSGRYGVLKPELVRDIHKLQGNIRSLVSMINDFLELARLEGAGFKVDREPVELAELVRHTAEEFGPLFENGKLEWIHEPSVGSCPVLGDRARLVQVLSNLIGNAIKFTPPGGRITTRILCDEGGAQVEVEDTGAGIAPEAQKNLFERYTRVTDDRDTVGGSGLGLMIVREIIQAHGGSVGVRSEVGRGSTFWFRLPPASASLPRG